MCSVTRNPNRTLRNLNEEIIWRKSLGSNPEYRRLQMVLTQNFVVAAKAGSCPKMLVDDTKRPRIAKLFSRHTRLGKRYLRLALRWLGFRFGMALLSPVALTLQF